MHNSATICCRKGRMLTIPNPSSVSRAFMELDVNDRMKPSPYYNRIVNVMEELSKRVNQRST